MIRTKVLGTVLVIHGLAHSTAGMWTAGTANPAVAALLWGGATLGFMIAGGMMLGFIGAAERARAITAFATGCSLALLILFPHLWFVPGIAIDVALLAILVLDHRTLEAAIVRHRIAGFVFTALVLYAGVLIATRYWTMSWGSTKDERMMALVGDPSIENPRYRIDHAVTIDAPSDSVWAWLVQLGQERAGFYSYDWLERAIGDDIHNVNQIVPEWQERKVGDLVAAAQEGYLGGIFGDSLGWRVTNVEPGKALVLEGWGSFVVHKVDATHSRLHVRTRGAGTPTAAAIVLAPVSFLTYEPAHFIMERAMLLGIKARAEGSVASP